MSDQDESAERVRDATGRRQRVALVPGDAAPGVVLVDDRVVEPAGEQRFEDRAVHRTLEALRALARGPLAARPRPPLR